MLLAGAALLVAVPSPAEACSCAEASLPAQARSTAMVFVGTVASVDVPQAPVTSSTDANGTTWVSVEWPGPGTATFRVDRVLKGEPGAVARIAGGWGCGASFRVGETWVVYASRRGDRLSTGVCSRTRLLQHARADLEYFDGVARGRPQGVVYGIVVRRGRDRAGQPVLLAMPADAGFAVVGLVGGHRVAHAVDASAFDLVLPAGGATVWVEREGRPVSPQTAVSVTDGGEHRLVLVTGDEDP